MAEAMTVKLLDGTAMLADPAEWRHLGATHWSSLTDRGFLVWTLRVARHGDGRTLMYVAETKDDDLLATTGILAPAGTNPDGLISLIRQAGKRFPTHSNMVATLVRALARDGLL